MILAGDIVTLRDYEPLDKILRKWKNPVLYVTGNHEYYTRRPMNEEDNRFKAWLEDRHPHVKLLLDEEVCIRGVNFFGGTMWTDFNGGDLRAMETARSQMNDYRLIYNSDEMVFALADSIALHKSFASKLLNWFGKNLSGPSVVVSHNAPVINPNSKYKGGPLTPAFNFPGHGGDHQDPPAGPLGVWAHARMRRSDDRPDPGHFKSTRISRQLWRL